MEKILPGIKKNINDFLSSKLPSEIEEQVKLVFFDLVEKFDLVSKRDFEIQQETLENAVKKIESLEKELNKVLDEKNNSI